MSYFIEEEHVFIKRAISAEYFFEMISFQFFVLKYQNYFEWKNLIDKRNQFYLYIIIFLRIFFYLIEIFFHYIFFFLKINFVFLKTFYKNVFLNFLDKIKIKKKYLVNDLYNSFSTKILISSTAFFVLYLIILLFFLYSLYFVNKTGENLFFQKKELIPSTSEIQFISEIPLIPNTPCKLCTPCTPYTPWIRNFHGVPGIPCIPFPEKLILGKIHILIYRLIHDYLENDRADIFGFTPVVYKRDLSDSRIILDSYVISTPVYYAHRLMGIEMTKNLLEELAEQLKNKIENSGISSEINDFNNVVFANELLTINVSILEEIEIFFENQGIAFEELEENEELALEEKFDEILVDSLVEFMIEFLKESILESLMESLMESPIEMNTDLPPRFNLKFILQVNILILIICLMNLLHTFIAFLSLGYDYLLKKLTFENILILYFISSTTLQIFFKILFIYFF